MNMSLNDLKSVDENILKLSGNKLAFAYVIDSGRFTVPLV